VAVADGRGRTTVPLVEGANAIEIVAVDELGHERRQAVTVVRDTEPPALTLAPPAPLVTAATLRLAGRVADATPVALALGTTPVALDAGGAFDHEVALASGENRLALTARDAAGNETAWSALVRFEPLPEGLRESGEPGVFVWHADGAGMVRADGPEGRMFVDRDEVTVAQYARFLAALGEGAAGHRPLAWARQSAEGRAGHPVVGVSAIDAEAYARWAGKQLPGVAAWTAAAGGAGRRHPWGDVAPDGARAVFGRAPGRRAAGAEPAGRPEGAAPCGARDLAGNVAEWTADEGEPGTRIVKGGGWTDEAEALAIDAWRTEAATDRMYTVGFRCVLPAPLAGGNGGGR
jgi:hypothetical protein